MLSVAAACLALGARQGSHELRLHPVHAQQPGPVEKWVRPSRRGMTRKEIKPGTFDGVAFYVDIFLGSNRQQQRVQFDTGSSDLAVTSDMCQDKVAHRFPVYDPTVSGQPVSCSSSSCRSGRTECTSDNACEYQNAYGDQSGFTAEVFRDDVSFGPASDSVKTDVAAFTEQHPGPGQSSFEPYESNGIMGMAFRTLSSTAQVNPVFLYTQQHSLPRLFSMCVSSTGGAVGVGKILPYTTGAEVVYEPVVTGTSGLGKDGYWSVQVTDVSVSGRSLGVSSGTYTTSSCIVDSGTTQVTLPSAAFSVLKKRLLDAGLPEPLFDNRCVQMSRSEVAAYPTVEIHLTRLRLALRPQDYITSDVCGGGGYYGLGIGEMEDTILGLSILKQFVSVWDAEKMRVGFAPMSGCPEGPPEPPPPPPAPLTPVPPLPQGGGGYGGYSYGMGYGGYGYGYGGGGGRGGRGGHGAYSYEDDEEHDAEKQPETVRARVKSQGEAAAKTAARGQGFALTFMVPSAVAAILAAGAAIAYAAASYGRQADDAYSYGSV